MSKLLELAKNEINNRGSAFELLELIIKNLRTDIMYGQFHTLSDELKSEIDKSDDLQKVEAVKVVSKSLYLHILNERIEDEDEDENEDCEDE